MSTKHRNHLIKAEASNVTTWCGKRSAGRGSEMIIRYFVSDEGGEFYATAHAAVVDCKRCLNAFDRRDR